MFFTCIMSGHTEFFRVYINRNNPFACKSKLNRISAYATKTVHNQFTPWKFQVEIKWKTAVKKSIFVANYFADLILIVPTTLRNVLSYFFGCHWKPTFSVHPNPRVKFWKQPVSLKPVFFQFFIFGYILRHFDRFRSEYFRNPSFWRNILPRGFKAPSFDQLIFSIFT